MAFLEEITNIRYGKTELRKFGVLMTLAAGLAAGLLYWKAGAVYIYLLAAAAVFLVLGMVLPEALAFVYKPWMMLARIFGWFVSRTILIILFYFLITPLGILLRLSGKQLLDIRWPGSKNSYWKPVSPSDPDNKAKYEKQF